MSFQTSTPPPISGYNIGTPTVTSGTPAITIGGINLGNLPNYLFFFANGSTKASWMGPADGGYSGNVAIDGVQANEVFGGSFYYTGTIYTNDTTLGAWQAIITQNAGHAFSSTNQTTRIAGLESNLVSAIQTINALPTTPLPPPYNVTFNGNPTTLNGLNTTDGVNRTYVINITTGFEVNSDIYITGDPGDVFILRWDTDANFSNGYQGTVFFHNGAIIPQGGLTPANFIHVAGDMKALIGGTVPPPPYPQGPTGGTNFTSGPFYTGYWLTTGAPDILDPATGLWYGPTQDFHDIKFVGGWYTLTTSFNLFSNSGAAYVPPNPSTLGEALTVTKEVSVDNGQHWFSPSSPGYPPTLPSGTEPWFRITVTNTGQSTLTNVSVTDSQLSPPTFASIPSLDPGASYQWVIVAHS